MADIKEIVEDENKIGTVIADDITFKGQLTFKNSLKIKGKFDGKIDSEGHLIIGREATVHAEVTSNVISIDGTLKGKLKANQKIELYKKSKTVGDIVTPDIYIESGAVLNGTCIMDEK